MHISLREKYVTDNIYFTAAGFKYTVARIWLLIVQTIYNRDSSEKLPIQNDFHRYVCLAFIFTALEFQRQQNQIS